MARRRKPGLWVILKKKESHVMPWVGGDEGSDSRTPQGIKKERKTTKESTSNTPKGIKRRNQGLACYFRGDAGTTPLKAEGTTTEHITKETFYGRSKRSPS